MTMFAVVCLTLLGGMAIMPEYSEPITNDPDPDGTDQLDPVNPSYFLDILIEYPLIGTTLRLPVGTALAKTESCYNLILPK